MRLRLLIVLLFITVTVTIAFGQTPADGDDSPARQQETKLTPEEEMEARALSRRFDERLRETDDLGPIVAEMFVRDFPERLRQAPQDWLPWIFLDKPLVARASPDELKRYYIASMSFYWLIFRLSVEAERLRQQLNTNPEKLKFEEIVSPEVMNTLLSNQTFAEFDEMAKERDGDASAEENDNQQPAESGDSAQATQATAKTDKDDSTEKTEVGIIKSLTQLNDASATFEKANELMRRRLLNLSLMAQALSESADAEDEPDKQKPDLTNLDEGEYGYSKDMPVIHQEAKPFCLYLVKVNGELRILSVHIYVD
jgi:hypothetical protein